MLSKFVLSKATTPSNNNNKIHDTITTSTKAQPPSNYIPSKIKAVFTPTISCNIINIISKIAIATKTPSPSCCYWRHHHPTTTRGQVFSTTLRLFSSLNAFNFCSGCAVCTIVVVLEPLEEIFLAFLLCSFNFYLAASVQFLATKVWQVGFKPLLLCSVSNWYQIFS